VSTPFYHLAQVNVAQAKTALDNPSMAEFVARIDELNALAAQSPGFVWRSEDNDTTLDDPTLLFNLSVWESPKSLANYVYRSVHVEVFRDRAKWFPADGKRGLAMWWIPAGYRPSAAEALERLAHLSDTGDGPFAFGFKSDQPPPPAPDEGADEPPTEAIWEGRTFRTASNSDSGEVNPATIFRYRQEGARVWATYDGGGVHFGSLVASANRENRLDMRYRHLSADGGLREGRCRSIPQMDPDGQLTIDEEWEWTAGAVGGGHSTLEQI